MLHIAEHGQAALLSVGSFWRLGLPATNHLAPLGSLYAEGEDSVAAGRKRETDPLLMQDAAGGGFQILHHGATRLAFFTDVAHRSRHRHLIAPTQEARHTELRHQGLLGYDGVVPRHRFQSACVGQAAQMPGGQTLGQVEDDGDAARCIRTQRGIEERGLGKVRTQRLFVQVLLLFRHRGIIRTRSDSGSRFCRKTGYLPVQGRCIE